MNLKAGQIHISFLDGKQSTQTSCIARGKGKKEKKKREPQRAMHQPNANVHELWIMEANEFIQIIVIPMLSFENLRFRLIISVVKVRSATNGKFSFFSFFPHGEFYFLVFPHGKKIGSSRPLDGRTNGRTDGRTYPLVEP